MPESKKKATARAKRLGFPKSNVVKAKKGSYFIAPKGVTTKARKSAYAKSRASGKSKASSAKIAHFVNKRAKRKRKRKR